MNQMTATGYRKGARLASHVRTFEDRGIKINFAHKALQTLRLKVPRGPDPRDWEASLQNFLGTGNTSFAVVNWLHLPNFVHMDRRDTELYEGLLKAGRQKPIDPFTVRQLHLTIESEFGATPDIRNVARFEMESQDKEILQVHLSFLAHLVRECTIKMGDTSLANATNESIRNALMNADGTLASMGQNDLMDKVCKYMARTYKIGPKELTEQVERLARVLAPFGTINASSDDRHDGFLSRDFNRLKTFHKELVAVEAGGQAHLRDTAAVILFATKEYTDLITSRLEAAEQKLSNFAAMLSDYDASIRIFRSIRRDVVFALDGWTLLIDIWNSANTLPEGEPRENALRRALTEILEWLPLLPTEEMKDDEDRRAIWKQYDAIRTNVVKLMHSWFDDAPDYEMMERLRVAKHREDARRPGKSWSELDVTATYD